MSPERLESSMSTDALNTFTDLLNGFERTVTFLRRIDEQAPNFRSEVVARVRASHEGTRDALLIDLIPALADAEEALAAANARASEVQSSVSDAREALEEIELRVEIGALEADEADEARAPYQAAIDGVADALTEVELEVEGYRDAIARWESLGQQGGVLR
jgi:chromosome segregation ATPase